MRRYIMWSIGLLAYIVAVFHRSSLGVAGVEAADRLGVGTALLSILSVAQLAVYAAMQIPVGVLLDRFGSRRLLVAGGTLMLAGQLVFAFAGDVGTAIAARVLIGVGDAMTFISVLRIVALWFPPRRNPLMVQLTGMVGQLGAISSAVPLVLLLRHFGWTTTFLAAGALGAAAVLLVLVALRDQPTDLAVHPAQKRELGLKHSWSHPGTRLGLWTHFVTGFPGGVFALLWGYPFLTQGEGVAPGTAALLLSLLTVGGIVLGPVVGHFCGRLPYHRSTLVLGIVGSSAAAWTAVLLWPGRAPLWLLTTLVVVLTMSGPGSMIGFDYARSFNPADRIGGATGIVNVGSFVASILAIVAIGVVLQLHTPPGAAHPSLAGFRWAFAVQYVLWAVGAVQVYRYRRTTRRHVATLDLALAPA
ncbi:MFS transporter [Dactylosporangium vinaceum]|uniref:Nitrate/nitrite transporter n=1 Tax=Dactylosporangium vinaceum TaxID=53362 RepID=A0ABV5MJ96_9ACTN|nr:MFS transporter [Dactylosporangium vinaceum]UAB93628.1 MFS transporter [Dactylosporangium vinaceum]